MLDELAVRLIRLFRINRLGTTVLIATHNEQLAHRFGHARLRLHDGRLTREDDGQRSHLATDPAHVRRANRRSR